MYDTRPNLFKFPQSDGAKIISVKKIQIKSLLEIVSDFINILSRPKNGENFIFWPSQRSDEITIFLG